jgi:protein-S-isoprenylcysteine O-methyltransferase Ste14
MTLVQYRQQCAATAIGVTAGVILALVSLSITGITHPAIVFATGAMLAVICQRIAIVAVIRAQAVAWGQPKRSDDSGSDNWPYVRSGQSWGSPGEPWPTRKEAYQIVGAVALLSLAVVFATYATPMWSSFTSAIVWTFS